MLQECQSERAGLREIIEAQAKPKREEMECVPESLGIQDLKQQNGSGNIYNTRVIHSF